MSNDNTPIPASYSNPISSNYPLSRSNGLAFAEGVILLGGFALLNYTGLMPFAVWPVHPFLFVVVLLSAQYGAQGGILAALGAIVLSHINGWPARPIDMTYAQYFRLAWADSLSWVLAALTVGIVTSHRTRLLQEQSERLRKATLAESLIAAQYEVLAQRTHKLERRLAGRPDAGEIDGAGVPAMKATSRSRVSKSSRSWNAEGRP